MIQDIKSKNMYMLENNIVDYSTMRILHGLLNKYSFCDNSVYDPFTEGHYEFLHD